MLVKRCMVGMYKNEPCVETETQASAQFQLSKIGNLMKSVLDSVRLDHGAFVPDTQATCVEEMVQHSLNYVAHLKLRYMHSTMMVVNYIFTAYYVEV